MLFKTAASFFFCLACLFFSFSQPNYGYRINTTKALCVKASAVLEVLGTDAMDTLKISWSNGGTDTFQVHGLEGGMHWVNIRIKRHHDTLLVVRDTTFHFFVEEEFCSISVDKYFSPNDDNYHDLLGISNTQFHPNFELNIFNRSGQRVHRQTKEYTPWDGKWNGIDLPDGTYYYVFFYDADKKSKAAKGDITILR